MECPACLKANSMHWILAENVIECRTCGHELTPQEYQRAIDGDYDRWLASPPEEDTP